MIIHNHKLILNIADIDECLSSPCDSNATCNNTGGSFTCTCVNGYSGDGFQCFGRWILMFIESDTVIKQCS